MFDVILEVHLSTLHSGYDKMRKAMKPFYYIYKPCLQILVNACNVCSQKKNTNENKVKVYENRTQFNDEIHVQIMKVDKENDNGFNQILVYEDVKTKFSLLRPLFGIGENDIALELIKIRVDFGEPRQFTTNVVEILKKALTVVDKTKLYSSSKMVQYEPHDAKYWLGKIEDWMNKYNSKNWTIGCYEIQFEKNTMRKDNNPYQLVFSHASDMEKCAQAKIPPLYAYSNKENTMLSPQSVDLTKTVPDTVKRTDTRSDEKDEMMDCDDNNSIILQNEENQEEKQQKTTFLNALPKWTNIIVSPTNFDIIKTTSETAEPTNTKSTEIHNLTDSDDNNILILSDEEDQGGKRNKTTFSNALPKWNNNLIYLIDLTNTTPETAKPTNTRSDEQDKLMDCDDDDVIILSNEEDQGGTRKKTTPKRKNITLSPQNVDLTKTTLEIEKPTNTRTDEQDKLMECDDNDVIIVSNEEDNDGKRKKSFSNALPKRKNIILSSQNVHLTKTTLETAKPTCPISDKIDKLIECDNKSIINLSIEESQGSSVDTPSVKKSKDHSDEESCSVCYSTIKNVLGKPHCDSCKKIVHEHCGDWCTDVTLPNLKSVVVYMCYSCKTR